MQPTRLDFYPLSFVPEGDDVLVGRPDAESYAVLPADGAALLERLANGMAPEFAADWYVRTYGETLDLADFLATLDDLGFVRHDEPSGQPRRPVRLRWLGRAMFSLPAFCCYLAVILGGALMMARHPELRPQSHHVFFTGSLLMVQLLIMFGQVPWLIAHEAFHVLAGRRLGLPSEVGIGTRLHVFIVVETRMNGVLSLPRSKRYLPYLAGMVLDLVAVSGLELIAYALRDGHDRFTLAGRVAQAMAFPILLRFFYQFQLFLQTDVYFALATAFGCYDLHAVTRAVVLNRWHRLTGRPDKIVDLDLWSDRDRRLARWYAPFFAVGVVVLIVVWLLGLLPVLIGTVRLAIQGLTASTHDLHFWDTTLFVVVNTLQLGLYFYISGRNYLRHRRTHPRGALA
jgi:hypothetical protein